MVFAHQEVLRTASARARESMKKHGKIGRSVLDPSKIDRGALQDAKKTDQKRERTRQERKMRLGSAQERKIAPTWVPKGLWNVLSVARLASPKAC